MGKSHSVSTKGSLSDREGAMTGVGIGREVVYKAYLVCL